MTLKCMSAIVPHKSLLMQNNKIQAYRPMHSPAQSNSEYRGNPFKASRTLLLGSDDLEQLRCDDEQGCGELVA